MSFPCRPSTSLDNRAHINCDGQPFKSFIDSKKIALADTIQRQLIHLTQNQESLDHDHSNNLINTMDHYQAPEQTKHQISLCQAIYKKSSNMLAISVLPNDFVFVKQGPAYSGIQVSPAWGLDREMRRRLILQEP